MTPLRLALSLSALLTLAPALLVLSACGEQPSGADERRDGPAAPLGFELAMAGVGAADDRDAAADGKPAMQLGAGILAWEAAGQPITPR